MNPLHMSNSNLIQHSKIYTEKWVKTDVNAQGYSFILNIAINLPICRFFIVLHFCKHMVLHGKISTLQIIILENLKLIMLLLPTTTALLTATFIEKQMQFFWENSNQSFSFFLFLSTKTCHISFLCYHCFSVKVNNCLVVLNLMTQIPAFFKHCLTFIICVWTWYEYPGLTTNTSAPFCFDYVRPPDLLNPGVT